MTPHPVARGFSLVTAMLMLAAIGLASAAIMRNAIDGQRMAGNNRLQAQANQYAQLALRLCRNQLALAPAMRRVPVLAAASSPAWAVVRSWTSSGPGAAHTLAPADIGGSLLPPVPPQCLVEATGVADVYTITARGFSADFRAEPITGALRSGAVVWLQTTLLAEGGAGTPGLVVRRGTWQQLVTPPF